jgi:mRNA interferase YafQ
VAKRKPTPKPPEPHQTPPEPLEAIPTKQFKRDVARQDKRGKDLAKLETVIESFRHHRPLDAKHRDHALAGEYKGWRDCHIEPDWVMIYKLEPTRLILGRTGSHSDLGMG